jgi:hypothetical protein
MGQAKEAGMWLGIANSGAITARSRVYEFVLGSHATPVDQSSIWSIMRTTTAVPTGGGPPGIAYNDSADGAALASVYQASTGGATCGKSASRWILRNKRR